MLRKWGMLVLMLLVTPVLTMAQSTGKLAGQVLDSATGDPLPGASVAFLGTTTGTITDVDGNYFVIGVQPGNYDVQASFVGYQTSTVRGVEIFGGYTREINFSLVEGIELGEIVVEYERPLIQKDAIGAPKVVTAEEIENLPVRGAASVAALSSGVVSNDGDDDLFIRGGREEQVQYFVDGVKIIGGVNSLGIGNSAIAEQELLTGSIPARYGDAQSGVISITTKRGGSKFFGTIEAITSEALDDFGYNLVSGSFGGPLIKDKLSFFISAQGTFQSDSTPYAVETLELTDEALSDILANPQALQYMDADGNFGYATLPTSLTPGTLEEIAAQIPDLPDGATLTTGEPLNRPNTFRATDDIFRVADGKDRPDAQIDVTGNFTINPTGSTSIRLGGAYANADRDEYSYTRSLYARNAYERFLDTNYRFFGTWSHRISGSTFYQIQAEFTDDKTWRHPGDFSKDIEDLLFYGDRQDARNSTLTAYRQLTVTDGMYAYSSPTFLGTDGDRRAAGQVAPSTFSLPGYGFSRYTKRHNEIFRISASATTQLGVHQIEFGGEYERQTRRLFDNVKGGQFRQGGQFSRYYADGNPEIGAGVTSYDQLPFSAFDVTNYGYDFRGLNEVDSQDIAAYIAAGGNPANAADVNVAPWEPIYYAGYISDKIEFRDLVLNIGVRVDVFDNNAPVLFDNLALAPVVRAGTLTGTTLPANIGSDFAVYYNGDTVVGYHDLDRNFYDENGQDATFSDLDAAGGRPRQVAGSSSFSADIFTDYDPQVTFMPRIGVSFPVTDQALFFASYNVTSQRPTESGFDPFSIYQSLTSQSRINNPSLEPEKTTQYELGFRQALTSRAALQISAFYRTQENLIQVRDTPEAFPGGYQGFQNIDYAATKGAEFEFDLRRTNNVSLRANYTLAFSEGTGSDAASLGVIAWRSSLDGYSPNFLSPTDFDRRHAINVSMDYRLGEDEGPTIFGGKPLANFGANLVVNLGSGLTYTRLQPEPQIITNSFTADVLGGINQARLPWTSLVNLRIDRRFALGGADLTAFLWVENLLDTENVLGVYRLTGLPDVDGYIDSQIGLVNADASAIGADDLGTESYIFNYARYADSPVIVGGNHFSNFGPYSRPRRTRLGVRLTF